MRSASSVCARLGAALVASALATGCSFDASPRAGADPGAGARPVTAAPALDAGAAGAPAPDAAPVATPATGPVLAPVAGGAASTAGMAAPIPMQSVDAAPPSIAEPARDAGTADAVAPAAEDAAAADVSAPDAAVNVDAAPPPGAMYSPCDQQTECASGLLCSSAAAWSAPGGPSYCTALCANTGTPENDCPQPGSGSVQASCYPTTGLCVLDSCEARECPSGLRCNRIETPAGGGQVFYLYVCQP